MKLWLAVIIGGLVVLLAHPLGAALVDLADEFRITEGRWRVPLTVHGDAALPGQVIHFSGAIPLVEGACPDITHVRVVDPRNGETILAGVQELSGWKDGSPRMVLLQFTVRVGEDGTKTVWVEYGSAVRGKSPPQSVRCSVGSGEAQLSNRFVKVRSTAAGTTISYDLEGGWQHTEPLGNFEVETDLQWREDVPPNRKGPAEFANHSSAYSPQYMVIEKTPQRVTLREQRPMVGSAGPPRNYCFVYIIDYTLWADTDYVQITPQIWYTGVVGPDWVNPGGFGTGPEMKDIHSWRQVTSKLAQARIDLAFPTIQAILGISAKPLVLDTVQQCRLFFSHR